MSSLKSDSIIYEVVYISFLQYDVFITLNVQYKLSIINLLIQLYQKRQNFLKIYVGVSMITLANPHQSLFGIKTTPQHLRRGRSKLLVNIPYIYMVCIFITQCFELSNRVKTLTHIVFYTFLLKSQIIFQRSQKYTEQGRLKKKHKSFLSVFLVWG